MSTAPASRGQGVLPAGALPPPLEVMRILRATPAGTQRVLAVQAAWSLPTRDAAITVIRATVRHPLVRRDPLARRLRKALRVASRRLPAPAVQHLDETQTAADDRVNAQVDRYYAESERRP